MARWAAEYAVAMEIEQPVLNLVLDRYIAALSAHLGYSGRLGRFGSFSVQVTDLNITDLEDIPPVGGGVSTDLQVEADFSLRLLGLIRINTTAVLSVDDVLIDLSKTAAGLPRSVVLSVTPTLTVRVTFRSGGLTGWFLNSFVAPLINVGVWLGFRVIRQVEIDVWKLVDFFSAIGLSFAPSSPLLTAQRAVPPTSLLLASDFNLTNPLAGNPNQLGHFVPTNTNLGAVVHERVLTAAVHLAFARGWLPTRFRVGRWRVYINSLAVAFEPGKVVASGTLRAKRRRCWCRVRARITFSAALQPRVVDSHTPNPRIEFDYDADINVHVSSSGMLVVLGVIMFGPLFLALTASMSFLINLLLDRFLPFATTWSVAGVQMTMQATSTGASGLVPFSMNFPLQLTGQGSYDLARFTQFRLPGGGNATMQVGYTPDSVTIEDDEIRVAIELT